MRAALAVVITTAASCTHHRNVEMVPPEFMGSTMTVKARDGRSFRAHAEAAPEGMVWRDVAGRTLLHVRDTEEAIEVDRGRGGLEGFGIGGAIGAVTAFVVIGALVVTIDFECHSDRDGCGGPSNESVLAVGTGAAFGLGAVIGAIVGANRGSRVVYHFER